MKTRQSWKGLIVPLLLTVVGSALLYNSQRLGALLHMPETVRLGLTVLAYFTAAWIVGRVADVLLAKARKGRKRPYPKLLNDLLSTLLYVVAFSASVALFMGQGAVGAVASSGLIIAVLGFSIRHVVADTLAGVALGIEGPFRIGDWVRIDDRITGKVIEIGWRTTRLLTPDSTYLILPNSEVSKQRIINYSAPQAQFRTQISITLDHSIPVDRAREVLLDAMESATLIRQNPAPDVRVETYGAQGITYTLRYWLSGFTAKIDARDEMYRALDKALRDIGAKAPSQRVELVTPDPKSLP